MMQMNISNQGRSGNSFWQLLAGLFILVPLVSAFFYGVVGEDKFLLLSPLVVIGYMILAGWLSISVFSKRADVVMPPAFFAWVLFIVFGSALVLTCPIPYEAKVRMLIVGLCVGAYLLWSNSFVLFRGNRLILGVLLTYALLLSMYGLVNFFKQPDMVLWTERWAEYEGRLASTYICPNHFGHLLQMLLPFAFVFLFIPQAGILLRILAGYCLILFPATIYFTESRASMLGSIAALGLTVLLLALRKNRKLFIFLLVAVPLGSTILLVGAWNYSEMFKRRMTPVVDFVSEAATEGFANTSTTDFRPLTWLDSMDMITHEPLTGFGPGSYRYMFPEYRKRFSGARVVSGHPHNEYLEVGSEYGLVGLGIFAVAWCWGLIRIFIFSLKTSNDHHAFMAMAFLGTAAGTMLHSFFDFQMHVFQNALVFCLLAGMAVGPICGRRQELLAGKPAGLRKLMMSGMVLIALVALVFSAFTFSSAFMRAKADVLAEAGKTQRAISLYELAIKADKTNWRAYRGLGNLYATDRWHSLDCAEKQQMALLETDVFSMGHKMNPKGPELAVSLGKASLFLGDEEEGLEFLRQATLMRPFNDNYWWTLGVEQRKAGLYEESLETFKRAWVIKKTPSINKNIEWLRQQLDEDSVPVAEQPVDVISIELPDSEQESDDTSIDDLHRLMDSMR